MVADQVNAPATLARPGAGTEGVSFDASPS